MKKLVLIVALGCSLTVFGQSEKGYTYVNRYKDIAIAEMQRTGVPAAITLAQGILESKYGESELCKKSNNHFGIKCKTEWTGEKVYHDDDIKHECFRVYPDAEASFRDHSDFLKNRPYYTSLFELSTTDVEGWCFGLKKAGYATEKDYPQRLLKIINDYNLSQYNYAALASNTKPAEEKVSNNNNAVAASSTKTTSSVQYTQNNIFDDVKKESKPAAAAVVVVPTVETSNNPVKVATVNTPASTAANQEQYPEEVFTINHAKVVYIKAGTSLLLIANQYDVPLSKLLDYNDMEETSILPNDQLIFIEKKLKKGSSDFHTTATNESLYDVSQKEGIRLENLIAFNGINKNAQIMAGEKIYLRYNAPVTPKTVSKENSTLGDK